MYRTKVATEAHGTVRRYRTVLVPYCKVPKTTSHTCIVILMWNKEQYADERRGDATATAKKGPTATTTKFRGCILPKQRGMCVLLRLS